MNNGRERNRILLFRGSVLDVQADAIVNSANCSLLAGGGICGAIHKAAGKELLDECKTLGGCKTGRCQITRAYNIKQADYIIHAVGPRWIDQDAPQLLWNCYYETLQLAAQYHCHSIAFPCISTGTHGMALDLAANRALNAIGKWFSENEENPMTIYLCCYREAEYETYREILYPVKTAP